MAVCLPSLVNLDSRMVSNLVSIYDESTRLASINVKGAFGLSKAASILLELKSVFWVASAGLSWHRLCGIIRPFVQKIPILILDQSGVVCANQILGIRAGSACAKGLIFPGRFIVFEEQR